MSGPTANPWIDSNGWLLRLAKVRSPKKTVWLMFEPPAAPRMFCCSNITCAPSPTPAPGAAGGWSLWTPTCEAAWRAAMPRRWHPGRRSPRPSEFFEQRRAWSALEPLGVVGVISDFAGPNETTSQEILNLMGRRSLAYRILETSAAATALAGRFPRLGLCGCGRARAAVAPQAAGLCGTGRTAHGGRRMEPADGQAHRHGSPASGCSPAGQGPARRLQGQRPGPLHDRARRSHAARPDVRRGAFFQPLGVSFALRRLARPDAGGGADRQLRHPFRRTTWPPRGFPGNTLRRASGVWAPRAPSPIEMVPENGGTSLLLPPVPVYAGIELSGKAG